MQKGVMPMPEVRGVRHGDTEWHVGKAATEYIGQVCPRVQQADAGFISGPYPAPARAASPGTYLSWRSCMGGKTRQPNRDPTGSRKSAAR